MFVNEYFKFVKVFTRFKKVGSSLVQTVVTMCGNFHWSFTLAGPNCILRSFSVMFQ